MFELVKRGTKFDFMGKAKFFFIISAIAIVASIAIAVTNGFNYGIDFAGGTVVQAKFDKTPALDDVRKALGVAGLGDVVIQTFGEENDILIRVEESKGKDLQVLAKTIEKTLLDKFEKTNNVTIERVEQVGPQVGNELKQQALMAVLYSMIGVLLYVALRFKFWYAVGAVLALVHDITITVGIFSITGTEVNLPIVAALLTIVGYSLNDTIVVFDRIRERHQTGLANMPLRDLMNISINETLSRTILTSFVTLLSVIGLYVFGGAVIHGFALALLVGIVVGTYSSIGIAAALVYVMTARKEAKAQ